MDFIIGDLNGEPITGSFYEKKKFEKKTNQKELRTEKIIKRKGDKLYDKWKWYDHLFNSWTNTINKTLYKNESILS